jgi:hypothetical protein
LPNDRRVTSADCDRAFSKPVIRQFDARLPEALHQSQRSLPLRIVLDHEWSALLNFGLRLPARQAPNQSFKLQFINDFRYLRYPRYLDKWVSANEPLPVTHRKNGAGDRIRTGDVQLGKLAFYQLNYSRSPGTFKYRKFKGLLASLD